MSFPIYHVRFPDNKTMGLTLFRFQEHYESPLLAGKVFDHEEAMDRYMGDGNTFTYAHDWRAFNLPSSVLARFRAGAFDPLWKRERALLDLFRDVKDATFYVIATVDGDDTWLGHEIAHGLYHLYPAYAEEVRACLARHDLTAFHEHLRLIGYADAVLDDATNAYHLAHMPGEMRALRVRALLPSLTRIFTTHFDGYIRQPREARAFARRIRRLRFPDISHSKA